MAQLARVGEVPIPALAIGLLGPAGGSSLCCYPYSNTFFRIGHKNKWSTDSDLSFILYLESKYWLTMLFVHVSALFCSHRNRSIISSSIRNTGRHTSWCAKA